MESKYLSFFFIYCVIFYKGVYSCHAQINQIASCPSKSGTAQIRHIVDNILGKWYMVAGSPAPGDPKVSKCAQLSIIKSSENVLTMRFTANSSRTLMPVIFYANATIINKSSTEEEVIGHWKIQIKNATKILGPFEYIIDHFKESYYTMAVCPASSDTYPPTTKIVMVLSREKNLSSEIINDAVNSYSSYLPKELFEIVDHSSENCTLKYLQ